MWCTQIDGSPSSGGVVGRARDVETLAEAILSIGYDPSEVWECLGGHIEYYTNVKSKIFVCKASQSTVFIYNIAGQIQGAFALYCIWIYYFEMLYIRGFSIWHLYNSLYGRPSIAKRLQKHYHRVVRLLLVSPHPRLVLQLLLSSENHRFWSE